MLPYAADGLRKLSLLRSSIQGDFVARCVQETEIKSRFRRSNASASPSILWPVHQIEVARHLLAHLSNHS